MALHATYKDGIATVDSDDTWWVSYTNFDEEAFHCLVSVDLQGLDSEKRAEHLTELQDFITTLQLESLQDRHEDLLTTAYAVEKKWKRWVIHGVADDEVNAAEILEKEKGDLEFEPTMDTSEFAEWFDKTDDKSRKNMIQLLEKSLEMDGISEIEKERIGEMLHAYS